MIRCMAPIVSPGAFMNQLHPNPHTLLQKKTHNSAITKTVLKRGRERERERELEERAHFYLFSGTFVTQKGTSVT